MKQPAIWWDFDHALDRRIYVERVIESFCKTPTCSGRARREDWRLAHQLYDQQTPLALVQAAFSLAAMRRLYRSFEATPLGPIRSLHYFLPILEEIRGQAIDPAYFAYVEWKVSTADTQIKSLRQTHGPATSRPR